MRYLLILLLITGCAKTGSESAISTDCSTSELVGTWTGDIGLGSDTMVISANCTTTSTYCQNSSSGTLRGTEYVSLYVETGPETPVYGCRATNTAFTCIYAIEEPYLYFNCGNDTLVYERSP